MNPSHEPSTFQLTDVRGRDTVKGNRRSQCAQIDLAR